MGDTGNQAERFRRTERPESASGYERIRLPGDERALAAAQVHHLDFLVVQEFVAAALITVPAEFEHVTPV